MSQEKKEHIVSLRVTPLYVVETSDDDTNNSITVDLHERSETTDEGN